MRSVPQNRASASATPLLPPSIRAALALLLPPEDARPADPSHHPFHPRIYAIAISRLRAAGLSDTELRWLIGLQLLEPQDAFEDSGVVRRRHRARADQRSEAASYQLTHAGLCWAREILKGKRLTPSVSPNGTPPDYGNHDRPRIPFWDADNRTLWWGDQILLQFHRRHAPNLEPLLAAFQSQHWKACIADPLAPEKESKFNPRLHDAIKYLNRRLRGKPIRFHGNGDGKSVRWEAEAAEAARHPSGNP